MIIDASTRAKAIESLHREKCSCVIAKPDGQFTLCHRRGVADLLELYPTLAGAFIADKVVGKGAAALMVAGGVSAVYTDVVSRPALKLLEESGVEVGYQTLAENIINRDGTDICPVEKLTAACATADECIPIIEKFVSDMISRAK